MIRVGVAQHQARNPGGIATYAHGLIEGLAEAAASDIDVRPLAAAKRSQNALTRLAWEQLRVPPAARAVDVLHMTDFRVPLRRPTPVVATVHDVSFITHPSCYTAARRRYKHAMFTAMLASRPDLVACDSQYTIDTLAQVAPTVLSRCQLLAPGLAQPPADFARTDDQSFFLTIGFAGSRKNLGTLLAAYRRARADGMALNWLAVGQPIRDDAPLIRALQDEPGVTLAGFVSQARLEELWAQAAFVAVPSILEGFSYPVLEAMQRGVPVIASLGTALDETAGNAAMRVDSTDVDGWLEALLRLAGQPEERQRLTRLGLDHARDFTWARRAPAFVAAYRGLLD